MPEFLIINCPHCGESFDLTIASDEADGEFIIDCEICCRPMTVIIRVTTDGPEVKSITAA